VALAENQLAGSNRPGRHQPREHDRRSEQSGGFERDTVALLVKEALYLANARERRELVNKVRRIFTHLLELYQDRLRERRVTAVAPSLEEIAEAWEQVLDRTGPFIRALMGFNERMTRTEVRRRASLFHWTTYIEPASADPIILHVAVAVEAAALALVLACLTGSE
jgi:hypothetical protein